MADIDSLSIQVNSNASQADDAIDRLIQRLDTLRNGVKDMRSLNVAARGIANMATAANSLSPDAGDSITRLANGLLAMQPVADMRISSSIGSQISAIGTAAAGLNSIDWSGVTSLAANLAPLQNIQRATDLNSIANTLRKIPQAIQTINQIDPTRMSEFANQINTLTGYMHPLADEMRAVSAGFSALPTNIRRAIEANERLTQSTNASTRSFGQLAGRIVNISALYFGMRRIASASMSAFQANNDYIESINLAQVAMGNAAEEAMNYAQKVEDIAGINMTNWISQVGSFNQVINGLGIANKQASSMSQQLVQLGYDIQSAFNATDLDNVMQALQSGITGQIKAMRQYGVELSVAAMQSYALSLGIDKQWKNMSAAEKVALRYSKIMHDTSNIQGDLARTIITPSNSLRILASQWQVAQRSMGQFVSVIAAQVIPWVQAGIQIIDMMGRALAKAFGYTMPKIDYATATKGFDGISDSIDDMADSASGAGGKIKNLLADFDELNVIQSKSQGGGSGIDAATDIAELYGLTDYTYDFLGGIDTKVNDIVSNIMGFWSRFKPEILSLLAGIATYKLTTKALQLYETLSKITGLPFAAKIAGGVALTIAGISLSYDGIKSLVLEGFTWESMGKTILGYVAEGLGGSLIASAAGVTGLAAYGVGFSLALSAIGAEIAIANIESASVKGYTKETFGTAVGAAIITGLGAAGATAALGAGGGIAIALGAVVAITAGIAYVTLARDAGYKYLAKQAFEKSGASENGFSVGDMLEALQAEMNSRVSGAKLSASVYADVGTYAEKVSSLAESISKLNNAAFGKGNPTAEQIAELKEAWAEFDLSYSKMNTTVSDTLFAGLNTVIESEIETLRGKAAEMRTVITAMTNAISEAQAKDIEKRDKVLKALAEGTETDDLDWYRKYASVMALSDEELRNQADWKSMFDENGMLTRQINYSSIDELKKFFNDVTESYTMFNASMLKGIDAQDGAVQDAKTSLLRELQIGSITKDQYDYYTTNLDEWLATYKQAVSGDMAQIEKEMDTVFANVISQVMMGMNGMEADAVNQYTNKYIDPLFAGIEKAYRDAGFGDKADAISDYFTLLQGALLGGYWLNNDGPLNLGKLMESMVVDDERAEYTDNAEAMNELSIAIATITSEIAKSSMTMPAADVSAFVSSMNTAIEAANRTAQALGNLGGLFGFTFSSFTPVQPVEIPQFATGGFPKAGELFIGNENGIEMMGQMGNRNVVANNEQIVDGIREGVHDANSGVESLLETLIEVVRGSNSGNQNGVPHPSAEFGRFVQQSLQLYADVTG